MTSQVPKSSIKAPTSSHTMKRTGEAQAHSPDPACMTALGKKQRRGRDILSAKYFLRASPAVRQLPCVVSVSMSLAASRRFIGSQMQGSCSQCPWAFYLERRVTIGKCRLVQLSAELVVAFNKPTCT